MLKKDRADEAIGCFELYRKIADGNEDVIVDSDLLVDQGRCYLALRDNVSAEECFIAAIEGDDENIDARFELAKIYEAEQEKEGREEAFLLVTEALNLEAQHAEDTGAAPSSKRQPRKLGPYMPGELRRRQMLLKQPARRRKRRPRRLGDSEARRKSEQERAEVLGETFRMCQEMRPRLETGDEEALDAWMGGAKELIDDFRSIKDFYPWDMYLKSQGFVTVYAVQQDHPHANANLVEMAARLQHGKTTLHFPFPCMKTLCFFLYADISDDRPCSWRRAGIQFSPRGCPPRASRNTVRPVVRSVPRIRAPPRVCAPVSRVVRGLDCG